jgi:hypothetical protein
MLHPHQTWTRKAIFCAVVTISFVLAGPVTTPLHDTARALPLTDLGVYKGAADPEGVAEFGRWLGRDPAWALDFLPGTTWKTIGDPSFYAQRWSESPYRVVYSVPMLPDTGPATLERGAAGAYDHHFRRLAEGLVDGGEGDSVIRLGWEFNGHWFRWSAAGHEEAFVAYWRNAVDAMRSVDDARFMFDWSPSAGPNAAEAEDAYPGDDYVDVIGLDVYDLNADPSLEPEERWDILMNEPYGLEWHRRFASSHDKPMSYPEWGLWPEAGGGGGDSPYFIEQMHRWTATNNVAYQMYFDYDGSDGVRHELSNPEYENAATRYRELFGLPLPLYFHALINR